MLLPRKDVPGQFFFSFPYVSAISFPHLFPGQAALKPGSAAKELHSRSVFVHLLPSLFLIFFLMRLAVQRPNVTTTREGHCRSVIISDLFPCQAMQRSRVSTG